MTITVAAQALRAQQPKQSGFVPQWLRRLYYLVCSSGDDRIVLETQNPSFSVSRFYAEFPQVEIRSALVSREQQTEWLDCGKLIYPFWDIAKSA